MNRFDLEEDISNAFRIIEDIEAIIYKIGDSPIRPTEDELLNMHIGIAELGKVRHEKLTNTFEALIANGVISNKNINRVKEND